MILVVNRYPFTEDRIVADRQFLMYRYLAVVLKKDSITYRNLSIESACKMTREIDTTCEVETRFAINIQVTSRPYAATMRKQPGKANAPSYIMNTKFYMIENFF